MIGKDDDCMTKFLTSSSTLPPYLAYPRFLLDMDISETSKLLYTVLLDRARLSRQNDGWTDENGHVYLYYTISNLAAAIHRSEMTVKTALRVLSDKGLIYRQRQGAGSPNKIYVKIPVADSFLSVQGQENCPSVGKKVIRPSEKKLSSNNTEFSNNKESKQVNDAPSAFGCYRNVLLTPQEYSALQTEFPDLVERIERLSSYMASSGKTYRNHAATIRLWAAKDKPIPARRIYECKEDESL